MQFYLSPHNSKKHVLGLRSYANDPWIAEDFFESMLDQSYFKVIFHENISVNTNELISNHPNFLDVFLPINLEASLNFEILFGHVTPEDYNFSKFYGKDFFAFFEQFNDKYEEVASQYYKYTYPKGQAWIGGYAVFTQEDPRFIKPNEDWILLLEIDTSFENGLDIMWGDAGVGTFFIRKKDLKEKDFSKVLYYWDNH